ncbi:hypothetical protein CR513_54142, partial [Mucuna pruriens]
MALTQKHILAAMVLVLLFSVAHVTQLSPGNGMGKCMGPCAKYPDCDGFCKQNHYEIGRCVHRGRRVKNRKEFANPTCLPFLQFEGDEFKRVEMC